ncbi:TPA: hypothetical protein ACTZGK_004109 [Raoultella planticola]
MNTTFLGQSEFIKHGGFLFLLSDESCLAVNNIEWAEKILSCDNVKFQNGRMSHEVAHEVMEESQGILLNFLSLTLPQISTQ